MKQLTIILLGLIGVAQAQFSPTSAKTAFKWGVSIGTRDSTAYAANDSLVVVINRQGRMMYRSTDGYWKLLANAASSDYVPYTGAIDNVNLGTYRLTARSLRTDSIYSNSSAGMYLLTNSGAAVAHWGGGGSVEVDFKGFAGYDANRAGSYTARSFTDKNYVDSADNLRLLKSDSATYFGQVVRTFGTQTIGGNKTFSNDIVIQTITAGRGGGSISSNTAFGLNALANNTSGASNTAIANNTLVGNTTGGNNIAVGTNALVSNQTTSNNLAIGVQALNRLTTGGSTIGIGLNAGMFIADGTTDNASATNSLFIGNNTRSSASGNTNETVIGASAIGNGSNTVTIGNSSVTNNYFSGNVRAGAFIRSGGTSSQFLKADGSIDGTAYGTGSVTSVSAGTGMSFTTITSSGAVNADTTTLATRAYAAGLDVGKANTSLNNVNGVLSSTYGGAGSVSGILKANGSGVVSAAVAGTDYVVPSALSGYLPLSGGTLTGALSGTSLSMSGGANLATSSGNVGIGTIPNAWLSTWKAVELVGGSLYSNAGGTTGQIALGQNFYYNGSQNVYINSAAASDYYQFGGLHVWRTASSGTAGTSVSFTEAMRISANRNLLIKTTTDNGTDALQVAGSGNFSSSVTSNGFIVNNSSAASIALNNTTSGVQWTTSSNNSGLYVINNGIGSGISIGASSNISAGSISLTGSMAGKGFVQNISTKTSNYTLTTNDHTVIFDVSGGNRTATLPAGVEGQIFVIKIKGSANNVNVNPNGSETIEGFSSWTIFGSSCGDAAYTFQFVSGNWYIISSHIPDCL